MVILIIVLLLASSAVAIYFNRQTNSVTKPADKSVSPGPEQSAAPAVSASTQNIASSSADADDIFLSSPNSSSTSMSEISPLTDYKYPGAVIINQTSVKLELESQDSSDVITQWYKDKIKQSGFNAKSFSQTNTNGVIFNKLSAAKPGEKIEINIKKDQNESKVTISVDRS